MTTKINKYNDLNELADAVFEELKDESNYFAVLWAYRDDANRFGIYDGKDKNNIPPFTMSICIGSREKSLLSFLLDYFGVTPDHRRLWGENADENVVAKFKAQIAIALGFLLGDLCDEFTPPPKPIWSGRMEG